MHINIKRTFLCIASALMLTAGGAAYADEENMTDFTSVSSDTEQPEKTEREKRSEASEKADIDPEVIEKYYTLAGKAEGISFYLEAEGAEERLWKELGFPEGRPSDPDELTDTQKRKFELAEKKAESIRSAGTAAAVFTDSKAPAAVFKKLALNGDEQSYISTGGRFLVTVSKTTGRLISVRRAVSTLDSKNAFLRGEGRYLDIITADNKKLDATYKFSRTENGFRYYESSDGTETAWLSEDSSHYYGTFYCAAENESFRMIADRRTAIFGIENKDTGYIWWSSPLDATQDTFATDLLVDELRSSSTLNYGIPETRNNSNLLRSGHSADCKMTVTDIENGIRVVYDYSRAGFRYPVEYTLEADHMRAYLKMDDVTESNKANIATQISVLGSFGAASAKEEGYFVIPDGSGALVRFNNGKSMGASSYLQRVYGGDVTAVPTTKGAVCEQIYLPVYGIVKKDNAMLAVAAKGDSNALLSAKVSKQSNTNYNLCGFNFIVRGTDTYYMSGSNQELTVFERGDINADDIELLYYPISKKNADYTDIAARYRQYLTEEKGVSTKAEANSSSLYVSLYGGVMKKHSILGIPVNMRTAVTTFDEAVDVLTRLRDRGVSDMVISYANWTNDGIRNKVDTGAKPSGILGGKKDFKALKKFTEENGFELYPVSDNRDFYSGNGYYSFTSTAVRISGSYSRVVSYDRAYGIPDGMKKNMSLLSPGYYGKVLGKTASSYESAGLYGVNISNLTTSLYGDYGKKDISRYDAMNKLVSSYEDISSRLGGGILADNANAYALPYVSRIRNVPLSSSRFDIFDEDIPFFQIVMHGLIPCSTRPVNASPDAEKLLLMAAATGSDISCDLLCEEAPELKDTEFDIYYYANAAGWIDTLAAEYDMLRPLLSRVSACTITGYRTEKDGQLITTEYSDGTVVVTDLGRKTVTYDGKVIDLGNVAKEGGMVF